jgi:hypothetical protein
MHSHARLAGTVGAERACGSSCWARSRSNACRTRERLGRRVWPTRAGRQRRCSGADVSFKGQVARVATSVLAGSASAHSERPFWQSGKVPTVCAGIIMRPSLSFVQDHDDGGPGLACRCPGPLLDWAGLCLPVPPGGLVSAQLSSGCSQWPCRDPEPRC